MPTGGGTGDGVAAGSGSTSRGLSVTLVGLGAALLFAAIGLVAYRLFGRRRYRTS